MLHGKKILLGITGSIAAYKSAWLIRLLVQSDAEVKVVLSREALDFVTPLTLSTLSKNPVYSDFTENKDSGEWNHHVQLALWADLFVMAPASANTLAKMASGQSDNFLLTTYMSTRCPVMFAPAMDHDMFLHPGTQENIRKLTEAGHILIHPVEGELASGLHGQGRMAEPEKIFDRIFRHFQPEQGLTGKTVLITAGPTYEAIDPVRFIGNRSSGKMGFALAEACLKQGAKVELVTGPVSLQLSLPGCTVHRVESAEEMLEKCLLLFPSVHLAILAAAVADYRPKHVADQKIKKQTGDMTIVLESTTDIARTLGEKKSPGQYLVGFALETNNEEVHALAKLEKKKLDMIVLNSLQDKGAGFGGDTNKISLFWNNNKRKDFGLKRKSDVAADIVAEIIADYTK